MSQRYTHLTKCLSFFLLAATGLCTPGCPSQPNGQPLYTTANSGDTCVSISQHYHVSTADLRSVNSLNANDCSSLSGKKLCIPISCKDYTVQDSDTCQSIVTKQGISSVGAFFGFNPAINDPACDNLEHGSNICLSGPIGRAFPSGASTESFSFSALAGISSYAGSSLFSSASFSTTPSSPSTPSTTPTSVYLQYTATSTAFSTTLETVFSCPHAACHHSSQSSVYVPSPSYPASSSSSTYSAYSAISSFTPATTPTSVAFQPTSTSTAFSTTLETIFSCPHAACHQSDQSSVYVPAPSYAAYSPSSSYPAYSPAASYSAESVYTPSSYSTYSSSSVYAAYSPSSTYSTYSTYTPSYSTYSSYSSYSHYSPYSAGKTYSSYAQAPYVATTTTIYNIPRPTYSLPASKPQPVETVTSTAFFTATSTSTLTATSTSVVKETSTYVATTTSTQYATATSTSYATATSTTYLTNTWTSTHTVYATSQIESTSTSVVTATSTSYVTKTSTSTSVVTATSTSKVFVTSCGQAPAYTTPAPYSVKTDYSTTLIRVTSCHHGCGS